MLGRNRTPKAAQSRQGRRAECSKQGITIPAQQKWEMEVEGQATRREYHAVSQRFTQIVADCRRDTLDATSQLAGLHCSGYCHFRLSILFLRGLPTVWFECI